MLVRLGDFLNVKRGTSLSGDFYSEEGDLIRLTLGNFAYPNGGFKNNNSKKDLYFIGDVRKEFILKKNDYVDLPPKRHDHTLHRRSERRHVSLEKARRAEITDSEGPGNHRLKHHICSPEELTSLGKLSHDPLLDGNKTTTFFSELQ